MAPKTAHMKRISAVDCSNYAICPECGERATLWKDAVKDPIGCKNGHSWLHKWNVGEMLYSGEHSSDYIYTDDGWEHV